MPSPKDVTLRTGPPTKRELLIFYPAKFTWTQLKTFVNSGYSATVPPEVEHTLIWTRLPIYHEDLVAKRISTRVEQDGLWGFTGSTSPPPSPSTLHSCLPALSDWGITVDKLIRSAAPNEDEAELLRRAGEEIQEFVRNRWDESLWETAWFVNPPVG
ncbi:hypothetical protein C0992_005044 [Termitomyces sp. T32_za158]|nr:hypothetical protein C0992_005044 [Termitomyces sp. T32_za158]